MKYINVQQGSQEWLDLRANHFTASEAPAMMGASKYTSRDELLKQKATGQTKEVTLQMQALFDRGHAAEEAARPLVEAMIGEELYPATAVGDHNLLASYDGITVDDFIVFEHKLWNEKLAVQVRNNDLEPHYYWQLEQQLLISGAEKAIFVTSNGTQEQFESMEYLPVPERQQALIKGWEQFAIDLGNFHQEQQPEVIQPVGKELMELPALSIQLVGEVKNSNLPAFKSQALSFIQSINTDLQTDQDFADAEQTVKFCTKAEKELDIVKKQALAQTADIDELFRTVDHLKEEMRSKRLELNKLVKARKDAIKLEVIADAQSKLNEHITQLNLRLPVSIPAVVADFQGAIKGRSAIKKIREAVNDTLAQAKIEATGYREKIETNLTFFEDTARDYDFLFADIQDVLVMEYDHMKLVVESRINEHKAAEEKRLEAERERIRLEEERKAKEALQKKADAEFARRMEEELAVPEVAEDHSLICGSEFPSDEPLAALPEAKTTKAVDFNDSELKAAVASRDDREALEYFFGDEELHELQYSDDEAEYELEVIVRRVRIKQKAA
ncbi:YqaJ viral recombinase family protein [Endozoicomonas gorgoniicola]|uniref:YqaJ viral recombinase family protein n=1 Tax=Endozoicomonas gorgoniicola TaxID=1234144 RepID=A0ABT3N493_9GAMM|nr:YqaJ viral recombinase family protein [Endozoicomonas gorgoniicola]MCW7556456.1 YqaJ viral recombinase family protein [Endozoicomonas gorgoniicola]MCW7556523.1 YqaJ viral recombinase family protein [Endozoicomonas gorgoniicola]